MHAFVLVFVMYAYRNIFVLCSPNLTLELTDGKCWLIIKELG